jgi:hypothetical protein
MGDVMGVAEIIETTSITRDRFICPVTPARTRQELWAAIGCLLDQVHPDEYRNYLAKHR